MKVMRVWWQKERKFLYWWKKNLRQSRDWTKERQKVAHDYGIEQVTVGDWKMKIEKRK